MAARNPVTLRVRFSGPFFKGDPKKTFRRNIADLMERVAAEGERDVKAQISTARRQMRFSRGRTLRSVRGRVHSLAGRRWEVSAVVSADTSGMTRREAIATKAAASSIEERFHPFRRTTTRLNRARREIVGNLFKDLE